MIGELVGNYRIVSKLGDGGMGVVYLAEHAHIGRKAAIKVLHVELCKNQEIVHRFFNEARATTQIKHPGLVDIFDFGYRPDGRAYIAMELLEGEALLARLRREAPFPPLVVLDISRQAAQALAAVHAKSIVHRDLKPDNIFLVPSPDAPGEIRVKILDFGVAKLLAEQGRGLRTATGMLIGTPSYMSPEQCRGSTKIDHRADIYALGCVMFSMACGRPPFKGNGPGDIIARHLMDPPPRPRSIVATVPEELSRIILRALEKKPEDRYQSMAAIVADIDPLHRRLKAASAVTIVPTAAPQMSAISANAPRAPRPVRLPGVPRERTINLDIDELIPDEPEPPVERGLRDEGLESNTIEERPDPAFVQQILSGDLDGAATSSDGDGGDGGLAAGPVAAALLARETVRLPVVSPADLDRHTTLGGTASEVMQPPVTPSLPALPSQRGLIAIGLVLLLFAGATTGGLVWLFKNQQEQNRAAQHTPIIEEEAPKPRVVEPPKIVPPPKPAQPTLQRLRSDVRGVEVRSASDGSLLGIVSAKDPLELYRENPTGSLTLRFHRRGYEDQVLVIDLTRDNNIEVKMRRSSRPPASKAGAATDGKPNKTPDRTKDKAPAREKDRRDLKDPFVPVFPPP